MRIPLAGLFLCTVIGTAWAAPKNTPRTGAGRIAAQLRKFGVKTVPRRVAKQIATEGMALRSTDLGWGARGSDSLFGGGETGTRTEKVRMTARGGILIYQQDSFSFGLGPPLQERRLSLKQAQRHFGARTLTKMLADGIKETKRWLPRERR